VVQFIINNQALPCLLQLLTNNHKKSIKKEACWTISNITAGNKDQIQVTLSGMHQMRIACAENLARMRKCALWTFMNAK
jgi:hypothetical protein